MAVGPRRADTSCFALSGWPSCSARSLRPSNGRCGGPRLLRGGLYSPVFEATADEGILNIVGGLGIDVVYPVDDQARANQIVDTTGFRWQGGGGWGPYRGATGVHVGPVAQHKMATGRPPTRRDHTVSGHLGRERSVGRTASGLVGELWNRRARAGSCRRPTRPRVRGGNRERWTCRYSIGNLADRARWNGDPVFRA